MKLFIALMTIAHLGLFSVTAFADPEPQASSAEVVTNRDLIRLYQVVSDPKIPGDLKSAEVDALFLKLDQNCQAGCERAISLLEELNLALKSKPLNEVLRSLEDMPESSLQKFPKAALDELGRRLTTLRWSLMSSSEASEHRAKASLGLLRYILSLKEKSLFTIVSKSEGHEKEVTQLRSDIQKIMG